MRLWIIVLLSFSPLCNATVLKSGDIFSFGFDTLPLYVEPPGTYPAIIPVTAVSFAQPFFQPNTYSGTIRLFEDNDPGSTPFFELTISPSNTPIAILGSAFPVNTWGDLNGLVQVEIDQGSYVLDSVAVSVFHEGSFYRSTVSPVAAPATAALLLISLTVLSLTSKPSRRRTGAACFERYSQ